MSGYYDIMEVDFITLGKAGLQSKEPIVRLLSNLLSMDASTLEEHMRVLEEDFDISMTLELEEEMASLCTLAEAILEEGMAKGEGDRGIHDIKCVMRNLMCTVERAMDILECDAGDRERLAGEVMASGE